MTEQLGQTTSTAGHGSILDSDDVSIRANIERSTVLAARNDPRTMAYEEEADTLDTYDPYNGKTCTCITGHYDQRGNKLYASINRSVDKQFYAADLDTGSIPLLDIPNAMASTVFTRLANDPEFTYKLDLINYVYDQQSAIADKASKQLDEAGNPYPKYDRPDSLLFSMTFRDQEDGKICTEIQRQIESAISELPEEISAIKRFLIDHAEPVISVNMDMKSHDIISIGTNKDKESGLATDESTPGVTLSLAKKQDLTFTIRHVFETSGVIVQMSKELHDGLQTIINSLDFSTKLQHQGEEGSQEDAGSGYSTLARVALPGMLKRFMRNATPDSHAIADRVKANLDARRESQDPRTLCEVHSQMDETRERVLITSLTVEESQGDQVSL